MSSQSGKDGPRYRHVADEAEPYETIGVEKLTPIIGAEISGVDIGKLVSDEPRSNRQMDGIHRALAENLVIFFRDQHITPAQHLAFGRKFGELHIHPAAPHEGDYPALMKIYADKEASERILRAGDLDWTLVYPTMLTNGPAKGRYRVGERLPMKGAPAVSRADVADFMVKAAHGSEWSRQDAVITD